MGGKSVSLEGSAASDLGFVSTVWPTPSVIGGAPVVGKWKLAEADPAGSSSSSSLSLDDPMASISRDNPSYYLILAALLKSGCAIGSSCAFHPPPCRLPGHPMQRNQQAGMGHNRSRSQLCRPLQTAVRTASRLLTRETCCHHLRDNPWKTVSSLAFDARVHFEMLSTRPQRTRLPSLLQETCLLR